MSIATYAELTTAVGTSWPHRTDLATAAGDFIRLGEAKLNRVLRLTQMQATSDITTSTTVRTVALPARFLEPLYMRFDNEQPLPVYAPGSIPIVWSAGKPRAVAYGQTIEFDRISDTAYTARLTFVKALDIATDTTNWLLTNFPDAYLYASLIAAEHYVLNDPRIQMWRALLAEVLAELSEMDLRARGQTQLTVDAALVGANRSSILQG